MQLLRIDVDDDRALIATKRWGRGDARQRREDRAHMVQREILYLTQGSRRTGEYEVSNRQGTSVVADHKGRDCSGRHEGVGAIEHGGTDAVVDATSNKLIGSVSLGGGAGNTVYDSGSGHILVAVHAKNDLVSIDPTTMKIVGRYQLPGVKNPHGIALDAASHLAFIAGEENHSLAVLDLKTMKLLSLHQVGDGPGRPRFRCGTQASVCLCGIGYRNRLPGERDRAAFTWTAPHAACSHGLRRPEDSPGLFSTPRYRRPPNPQNHETSRSAVTARREALAHRCAGALG